MNFLPLLLAAAAVLLAAAAFLRTFGSRDASASEEAGRRDAALLEALRGLAGDVGAIRAALESRSGNHEEIRAGIDAVFGALEVQGRSLQAVAVAVEALPAATAQAGGAAELLGELRSVRTATGAVVDRVSSVHIELQSASRSREEALAAATAEIGRKLSSIQEALGTLDATANAAEQLALLRASSDVQGSIAAGIASLERATVAGEASATAALERLRVATESAAGQRADILGRLEGLSDSMARLGDVADALPARTAEEIAARPSPAPELEELAIAVREAGSLRGDSVRSVADAVSRVAERLEASADDGREAREEAARRLSESLGTLEAVSAGIREALLPLGEALKGHGEAVLPVVKGLELAQDRLEEAGVSLRANQVEFAASVGVFSNAAQDLSSGLGAFAREGIEEGSRDPAALQAALLESLDRLLGGFSDSLRATLVEADLRHREALAEIAARLPAGTPG